MGYVFIFLCIVFTVYAQLVLKWRLNSHSELPEATSEKLMYLANLIVKDPFILSGFAAAFIASLFWMAAMTKFSISFAYPFMSLAFVLVMLGAAFFFGESLNFTKVLGTLVIMSGLVILSKGY